MLKGVGGNPEGQGRGPRSRGNWEGPREEGAREKTRMGDHGVLTFQSSRPLLS